MKYISDIIPITDIEKWIGKRVLISAMTGSGKSHFIKNTLYDWCKNNGKRMLLLTNRKILKNQNNEELKEKIDLITTMNYQSIESGILETKEDMDYYFSKFDVIVADEFHYFFQDSDFNRNTDLLLDIFVKEYINKILIFISATPEVAIYSGKRFDFTYSLKRDYSHIESIYFFRNEATPEAIIQNLPYDEKIIYFANSAMDAYDLSKKLEDATFICSSSNKMLYKFSDQETEREIVEERYFSKRVLCTTSVMENGISICDDLVKSIIVDFINPITLIQSLGRKRIMNENDKIKIFIKNHHNKVLQYHLNIFESKISLAEEREMYDSETFSFMNKKTKLNDILDNDLEINVAKFVQYKYQIDFIKTAMKRFDGFKYAILDYIGIDENSTKDADEEFEKMSLEKYLLKKKKIKMFKEDKEDFKSKFFNMTFKPHRNINYRHRGIQSINAILLEDSISLELFDEREKERGEFRDRVYWIIDDRREWGNQNETGALLDNDYSLSPVSKTAPIV